MEDIIDAEVVSDSEDENESVNTECAFVVMLDESGHWIADGNLDRKVNSARNANVFDFFHAAATIQKDITVSETARQTIIAQQQIARQMAEQMETQKISQQAGLGGCDLSKLKGR